MIRIFEESRCSAALDGGYDAIRRYARSWTKLNASATADAFVPLTFAPGEAYQFDWSHEIVVMDGVTTIEGRASPPLPQPDDVGEGLGLLENWLGCTLPKSQQEGGLSVGAVGPQGASQWRDYPRRRVHARSFAP